MLAWGILGSQIKHISKTIRMKKLITSQMLAYEVMNRGEFNARINYPVELACAYP